MAEHLIHDKNWFSKYEAERAEQTHYSAFKPAESTAVVPSKKAIDIQGTNTKENGKKEVAKSIIVIDIKPWDDETDIDAMEQAVRSIAVDGLLWGQSKRVPVAFGINKLEIGCVVEDDKIGTDFLEEKICEFDDYVQSIDIVSFTKS